MFRSWFFQGLSFNHVFPSFSYQIVKCFIHPPKDYRLEAQNCGFWVDVFPFPSGLFQVPGRLFSGAYVIHWLSEMLGIIIPSFVGCERTSKTIRPTKSKTNPWEICPPLVGSKKKLGHPKLPTPCTPTASSAMS